MIDKIKTFFSTVKNSAANFSFYKELTKKDFKYSLKYLFFVFYTLSLIGSIFFAAGVGGLILPNIPKFIDTVRSQSSAFFPDKLVVNIENGQVSTNQKEPYYLELSQNIIPNPHKHFITIDTKASPSDIKSEDTLVLITKDSFVTLSDSQSYKVSPIDSTLNAVIDKNTYESLISKILPYLNSLTPIVIGLIVLSILLWPFVAAAFSLVGQLIYLLIFSLIFMIVIKVMKKKLTFKKVYQLAMHASTLPIILAFVVSSVGITMPFLLGSIILLIFMILVINHL